MLFLTSRIGFKNSILLPRVQDPAADVTCGLISVLSPLWSFVLVYYVLFCCLSFPSTCPFLFGCFAVLFPRCCNCLMTQCWIQSLHVVVEYLKTCSFYWGISTGCLFFWLRPIKRTCLRSVCKPGNQHAQTHMEAKLGPHLLASKFSARCLISVCLVWRTSHGKSSSKHALSREQAHANEDVPHASLNSLHVSQDGRCSASEVPSLKNCINHRGLTWILGKDPGGWHHTQWSGFLVFSASLDLPCMSSSLP